MNIVKNNKTTWFLTVNQQRFWLQSDNTVKEVRNTYGARDAECDDTSRGVVHLQSKFSGGGPHPWGCGWRPVPLQSGYGYCNCHPHTAGCRKPLEIKAQSSFPCTWHRSSSGDYWEGGMWDSLFYVFGLLKKTFGSNPWTNCPWKVRDWVSLVPDHVTFRQRIQDPKAARGWGGSNTSSTQFHLHPRSSLSFLFRIFKHHLWGKLLSICKHHLALGKFGKFG